MRKRVNLRWWSVTVAGVLTVMLVVALGFWQLGRAAKKQAWMDAVQQQSSAAVLNEAALRKALPDTTAGAVAGPDVLHRHVRLQGVWLPQHAVYLDNRQMQGHPGFYVMTPLKLDAGDVVWVQRGWIARNFQVRQQLAPVETPQGVIQLIGRVSGPPARTYALGAGDAPDEQNPQIRQNLDIPRWAQSAGLSAWPVTVVQLGPASEGLLRDWPQASSGIATHHGYAFQWFAIAAVLAGMLFWFQCWRPLRAVRHHHVTP